MKRDIFHFLPGPMFQAMKVVKQSVFVEHSPNTILDIGVTGHSILLPIYQYSVTDPIYVPGTTRSFGIDRCPGGERSSHSVGNKGVIYVENRNFESA